MAIFIRKKDYDAIKSGEEIEIVVEAQGREPAYGMMSAS